MKITKSTSNNILFSIPFLILVMIPAVAIWYSAVELYDLKRSAETLPVVDSHAIITNAIYQQFNIIVVSFVILLILGVILILYFRIKWLKTFKKLLQSGKNYQELVENSRTIVLKMDMTGTISYFNEYAESFFGFSKEEILGKHVIGTIVPYTESSGRNLEKMISELLINPTEFNHNINENIRKNGERIWISWSNHLLSDENWSSSKILCIGEDITKQKTMAEALRISEERFRTLVENANDVVFALTPEGIFSYLSPQWKEAFDYEIEETVGKSFELFLHPEDIKGCTDFLKLTLSSDKKQSGFEYRVKHKNGSWHICTVNGSKIIDPHKGTLFVGIGRDITDYKKMQEEQIKGQRLESLATLAAGIAHNFNNTLTGVIGYLSYSRKYLNEPDKISPILEAAEKSSYRASTLARQLLNFAKGGSPDKKLYSPSELAQESMNLFLSGTSVKGEIKNNSKLFIYVDNEQFHQVCNNIIINAIHAMPDGGRLTVEIKDIFLDKENLFRLASGKYVQIDFADSGCGITPENITKIFDPYFTTRPEGTGLGLSTSYSIIMRNSGHIEINSIVGSGTVVSILLPGNDEENASTENSTTTTENKIVYPQRGCSVLIMDDDEDVREVAMKLINDAGYYAQTCRFGEEAVAIYKEIFEIGGTLPIVILDLAIQGGMGGEEAAREILSINPNAILIVSSGFSNNPIMSNTSNSGFCASLPKPYSLRKLLETLREVQSKK